MRNGLMSANERLCYMGYEYGTCNYIELDCKAPWRMGFVHVDTSAHLADRIFINHEIRVKFDRDFVRDSCPYIYVFCRIRKRDRAVFLEAMADLERKVLLTGHMDYRDFCHNEFFRIFDGT